MISGPQASDELDPGSRRGQGKGWTISLIERPWLLGLLILALSVAVRVGELDAMVNVDMYLFWSRRVVQFMQGVTTGEFALTCQSHHPGVTFMWLTGLLWKSFGVLDAPLDPVKVRLAVMPVVTLGSLFPVATFGLLVKLLGRSRVLVALFVALLFATEPLFVAHSRNAHLDVMVTSFSWVAVLCALIAKRRGSMAWAVTSGVCLGLALLTKLSAAGYALGIALVFGASVIDAGERRARQIVLLTLIVVCSAATVVVSWPALWISPIAVLERLHQGLTTEVDKIGPFMFLGETGRLRLPFWIYGVFLVMLVTPEFFLPGLGLLATAKRLKGPTREFAFDAILASAPLIVLVLRSHHVGNRYLIPMLPIFGTLAGIGLAEFVTWLGETARPRWMRLAAESVIPVLVVARVARLVALYPLPITYCSSWTGLDCGALFHIGWGEGMKQAAQYVAGVAAERAYPEKLTIYGSAYASTMSVWAPLKTTKDLSQAHLLVWYLPDQQRQVPIARAIEEQIQNNHLSPLYEVKLNGRTYVTLYPGPRY